MDYLEKIFYNPIISENILKYFSAKQLLILKRVTKNWLAIINQILEKRQLISWSLLNYMKDTLLEEKLSKNYNLDLVPNFALLFISYNLYAECYSINNVNSKGWYLNNKTLFNYLKKKLPSDCIIPYIVADGVIGSSFMTNFKNGKDMPKIFEYESAYTFSSYFFSSRNYIHKDLFPFNEKLEFEVLAIPKKDLKLFIFNKQRSFSKIKTPCFDFVKYYCNKRQKKFPENTKCILFFADSIIETQIIKKILKIVKKTFEELKQQVTICGALVDGLDIFTNSKNNFKNYQDSYSMRQPKLFEKVEPSVIMIFISGDIIQEIILDIVPSSSKLENEAEQNIKSVSLKYHNALERLKLDRNPSLTTFGFMFSCIGRGKHMYSMKENVESRLFMKYLPGIPLIGLFGNGEVAYQPKLIDRNYQITQQTHVHNTTPQPQEGDSDQSQKRRRQSDSFPNTSNYATGFDLPLNQYNLPNNTFANNSCDSENNDFFASTLERYSLPYLPPSANSILSDLMSGDRLTPKLDSEQFIYYYSSIFCLIITAVDR